MSEQQEALDRALQGESFFLTGAAGTGKTWTLNAIVQRLKSKGKRVGVTASTALAASRLDKRLEACSFHKFLGITNEKEVTGTAFRSIDVLVIDEISMIGDKLFDIVEGTARRILNHDLPMGGIQVIGCGDFHQLRPVESDYCFLSKTFRKVFPIIISLHEVYRQKNLKFINILKKIRIGDFDGVEEYLNSNCKMASSDDYVYLYPHSDNVDKKNETMLDLMAMPKIAYLAKDTDLYTTMNISSEEHQVPERIELSVGCPVIITHDVNNELYTGLRGKVVSFTEVKHTRNKSYSIGDGNLSFPRIEFNGKIITVEPCRFHHGIKENCYREQIPLSLSWAMTICKAQGMTLSGCNVDLRGTNELGQVYVALSRVSDPRKMFVNNFSQSNLQIDRMLKAFHESLEPIELLPGETLEPIFGNIFGIVKMTCLGEWDSKSHSTSVLTGPDNNHESEIEDPYGVETELETEEAMGLNDFSNLHMGSQGEPPQVAGEGLQTRGTSSESEPRTGLSPSMDILPFEESNWSELPKIEEHNDSVSNTVQDEADQDSVHDEDVSKNNVSSLDENGEEVKIYYISDSEEDRESEKVYYISDSDEDHEEEKMYYISDSEEDDSVDVKVEISHSQHRKRPARKKRKA